MIDWLWAPVTLAASAGQTARNAFQRDLTAAVGPLGAAHARFLYGLPFAALFLLAATLALGAPPAPGLDTVLWAGAGGVTQIAATALLLSAMRARSFVVAVAYTKSEPAMVLLFGWLVLGEGLRMLQAAGVLAATTGVMLMSWPARAVRGEGWLRPVAEGLGAGALFAVSSVCYRGGVTSLPLDPDAGVWGNLPNAGMTLVIALAIQAAGLSAWLMWRDPAVMRALIAAPRRSIPPGFLGAGASFLWFVAFALQTTALVRTLALAEILFAQLISRRVFREAVSARELAGMGVLALGLAAALLG